MDRQARSLERSQFDVEFRPYAKALYWFAAIVGVMHLVKHVLIATHQPSWAVLLAKLVQFGSLLLVFWCYRPKGLLPTSTAERQLWAVWIGYVVACVLTSGICWAEFGRAGMFTGVVYPFYAVLPGLAFFVLGSSYWGRLYAVAVAFFVLPGVMLLDLHWASLEFGAVWTAVLLLIGRRLEALSGDRPAPS